MQEYGADLVKNKKGRNVELPHTTTQPHDLMSTKKALEQIFDKLTGTTKWQLDFFIEIFNLIYSIQGRFNFQNLNFSDSILFFLFYLLELVTRIDTKIS